MKIKLFSTFIALALLVTVGGVYATWTYASSQEAVKQLESDVAVDVQITATEAGSVGTITMGGNPYRLMIGEKVTDPTNIEDYVAVLNAVQRHAENNNDTSGLKVHFTPAENAPLNYKDSVSLTIDITFPEGSAYDAAVKSITLDASNYDYTKDESDPNCPVFTWTVDIDTFGFCFADEWENTSVATETKAITEYATYVALDAALEKKPHITISLVME